MLDIKNRVYKDSFFIQQLRSGGFYTHRYGAFVIFTLTMLNTPFQLPCGAVLQNRLAKAAMTERLCGPDHLPNELHSRVYDQWAETRTGFDIVPKYCF